MERPSGDHQYIATVKNLIDPQSHNLYDITAEAATALLVEKGAAAMAELSGSFALLGRDGQKILLARSLDRPMRYFLAKEESGPMLIVAERIDEIRAHLAELGFEDQFHPSYTRMVPTHYVTELQLVGCPDPNPVYERFFDPPRETLPADEGVIGKAYVEALHHEVHRFLDNVDDAEPLGVCFSGGIDSGAVLVSLERALRERGQAPTRLKAFTLNAGGGADVVQAREFLRKLDLEMLGEEIEVAPSALDPLAAIEVIEDYKPLDVECATVGLALLQGIRDRYPEWRQLVDGDGGDENLKDYPIEENSELTIRSVVNNLMLYQEGWGVESIKHSLTYSGGLSRGYVRTYAPARHLGFRGFSPFTRPAVIQVAEAIPFAEMTQGSHDKLYALKGEVVRLGMEQVLGVDFPVYPKRRFQQGAASEGDFARVFDVAPETYRQHFTR
ncbi:MAG: asparagine synthase-related protein, partial [Acidobacteriota bacterium]